MTEPRRRSGFVFLRLLSFGLEGTKSDGWPVPLGGEFFSALRAAHF